MAAAAGATVLLGVAVANAAPLPPDDLGDDADLDVLAQECFDGVLHSCDLLFLQSPAGSDYEEYGDTCAGRQEAGTEQYCELGRDEPLATTAPSPTSEPGVPTSPPETTVDTVAPVETSEPTVAPDTTVDTTVDTVAPVDTSEPADTEPDPSAVEPTPPTGLGTDATLDALAEECYAGDMEACDDLYFAADPGTPYREYGDTCAGRQPVGTGKVCELITDPAPGTTEPAATEPAATEPAATEPVVTEPTATTMPTLTVVPATSPPTTDGVPTVPPVSDPGATTTVPGVVPPATQSPVGLGDDPALDALAQSCFYGDMEACDTLFEQAREAGLPAYQEYADTCAGRQPLDTGNWCADTFPGAAPTTTTAPSAPTLPTVPPTTDGTSPSATTAPAPLPAGTPPEGLGDDPGLDALATSCYAGDMAACDTLFDTSPIDSPYHTYGDTCGGRQPAGTFKYCRVAFPQP